MWSECYHLIFIRKPRICFPNGSGKYKKIRVELIATHGGEAVCYLALQLTKASSYFNYSVAKATHTFFFQERTFLTSCLNLGEYMPFVNTYNIKPFFELFTRNFQEITSNLEIT